jgi:hypothetical protein
VCVFLAKARRFIAIIVPLTNETIYRFILVKPIGQSILLDFEVFILDEHTIDQFTWYGQTIDRFNLKFNFMSFKPNQS